MIKNDIKTELDVRQRATWAPSDPVGSYRPSDERDHRANDSHDSSASMPRVISARTHFHVLTCLTSLTTRFMVRARKGWNKSFSLIRILKGKGKRPGAGFINN